MRFRSPGYTYYRRRQVGGLHRYIRPLGSTWLIAALGGLVLAAAWVLHGKADAALSTAREALPAAQPARAPDATGDIDPSPHTNISAPRPAAAATPSGQKSWVLVTAYCPCSRCCGDWARRLPRRFADGTPVAGTEYALAADTGVFPFGTRIRVPGYADGDPVPVLDVGAAVSGRHIEIFFHGDNAHRRARQWGSRWMEVEVLDGIPER